ncbi:MAG: hypothetical protein AB1634_17115 [Thermodesulfobacteriota bacterium]
MVEVKTGFVQPGGRKIPIGNRLPEVTLPPGFETEIPLLDFRWPPGLEHGDWQDYVVMEDPADGLDIDRAEQYFHSMMNPR